MLVKLRRNWFGPGGVQYLTREGPVEIPEALRDQLPSDAVVLSEKPLAFDVGKPKLPGFGAKPMHELVLDEIPSAAPTHMITEAGIGQNRGPFPPKELTPEAEKELSPAQKKARADQQKRADEAAKEEQKSTDLGIDRAKEKAELVKEQKIDL